MWTDEVIQMIITGVGETLYMTLCATVLGYLFGLPMGVLLTISDKGGLKPNKVIYKVLDVIANIVRSVPFLILLIVLIPFTRLMVGKIYGPTATIVSLTVAAIPFIGRMVESSLKEVDEGVVEAKKVYGSRNIPDCVEGTSCGGKNFSFDRSNHCHWNNSWVFCNGRSSRWHGLGAIAIQYGYYRYETGIMIVTVILLIVLFQIFQSVGMHVASKLDKRK